MLTINKCYTDFILSMSIAQSKRKLIAATGLFIAVGALTGAIATGGAATISFAQTQGQDGAATATGEQGGQARIIRQGTVTSEQNPLVGLEEGQRASILPLTQDGSIYSGVLTYTATAPVEVVVLSMQNLNETEQAILNGTEDGEFGTLITSRLDNETSIALNIITPPYGDTPIPSASIPFAGNALWLHSLEGTPFAATFTVSAQVLQAETLNNINNATEAVAEDADADAAEDADADAAEDADADAAEDADADAAEDADAEDGDAAEDGAANGNTTATEA
jgi:hypothetical protein